MVGGIGGGVGSSVEGRVIKRGGDGQHRRLANLAFELLQIFLGDGLVHFVGDDEARLFQQRGIVKFQFLEQLLVIVPRLRGRPCPPCRAAAREFCSARCGAETWPRPTFLCAPSINPGTSQTVSRWKSGYSTMPICGCSVVNGYGATLGRAWEMAVSKRGFARVRITDEADFGHDAQFQKKIALVARLARLRETRRLARGGGEVAIAQSAASAFAQNKLLSVFGEVGDQFAFGSNGGFPDSSSSCSNQFPLRDPPPEWRINSAACWCWSRTIGVRRSSSVLRSASDAQLPLMAIARPACRTEL